MSKYGQEYCNTASYTLKDQLIDVRLDGKPVPVHATWCSRHDRWISACAFEWYLKANPEVAAQIEEDRKADTHLEVPE